MYICIGILITVVLDTVFRRVVNIKVVNIKIRCYLMSQLPQFLQNGNKHCDVPLCAMQVLNYANLDFYNLELQ